MVESKTSITQAQEFTNFHGNIYSHKGATPELKLHSWPPLNQKFK